MSLIAQKKRKFLHRSQCQVELLILNEVISVLFGLSVVAYQELKNCNALLCVQCQKLLLKHKRLKNELQNILDNIKEKLNSLHVDSSVPSFVRSGRKRLLTESSETEQSVSDTGSPTVVPSPVTTPDASVSMQCHIK